MHALYTVATDTGQILYYKLSTLQTIYEEYSGSYDYIVGITNVDITFTKKDPLDYSKTKSLEWKYRAWGIFGLGSCPGKTCIISTFRLAKKSREKLSKDSKR